MSYYLRCLNCAKPGFYIHDLPKIGEPLDLDSCIYEDGSKLSSYDLIKCQNCKHEFSNFDINVDYVFPITEMDNITVDESGISLDGMLFSWNEIGKQLNFFSKHKLNNKKGITRCQKCGKFVSESEFEEHMIEHKG